MTEEQDRREHPRISVTLVAEAIESMGKIHHPMRTDDLSMGGLKCYVSRYFPEMSLISVRLELPLDEGVKTVSMEGVVMHIETNDPSVADEKYSLGIHFSYISEPDRQRLEKFLSSIEQKP